MLEDKNWWYVGKRKIVLFFIKEFLGKRKGVRLLDVGCGTGIMLKKLIKYGEVFGVDISKFAIEFCKKRTLKKIFLSSATDLQFPDNYFDLVLVLDILEHLEDDLECLEEVKRVLKTDGVLILSVPAFPFLFSYHDIVLGHKRRYEKKELSKKISSLGFKIYKLTFTNFFIFPIVFIVRNTKKLIKSKGKLNCDIGILPKFFNDLLIVLYKLEVEILKKTNFPWGVSLLCIAKKT